IGEYLVFEAPTTEDGVTTYDEKTYNLYIWIDETGVDQSDMMGETFKTTIQAESEAYWTSPESDFTVTEAGVLTKYTGTDKTVVIPPVVNGVTVTEIGAGDYNYVYNLEADENGIITIVIPNTVNRINDTAFMELGSMLDGKINFIIPNSVTYIGYGAFLNSDIYNISIPNSVTHLGVESFSVNNLTSIFIPNTVTEIGGQSFSNNNLGGVVIPSSVTNVSADESGLFWYNKNSDLIITVQGKSSTPNTFFEGWNLKESGAETFTTVYVP
ncbi:MAG: leucine-rich repeat domain-containing protein, partial [Bacilli bacterium]|nr:leucine-rich repeat domain-containing protein [Bacilli bacterium]